LLSILLARALEDHAFDGADFKDIHELLSRPRLAPGQNFLPLKFKAGKLKELVFKLAYNTYRECFQKTVLAAGYRDPVRPYALRVGAGHAFDGNNTAPPPLAG
jgi:hypothetical protein